jgi:pyruvate carboxylase
MTEEEKSVIRSTVQEAVDTGLELFSLEQYINCCDDLSSKEKKWAKHNLIVEVSICEDRKPLQTSHERV